MCVLHIYSPNSPFGVNFMTPELDYSHIETCPKTYAKSFPLAPSLLFSPPVSSRSPWSPQGPLGTAASVTLSKQVPSLLNALQWLQSPPHPPQNKTQTFPQPHAIGLEVSPVQWLGGELRNLPAFLFAHLYVCPLPSE